MFHLASWSRTEPDGARGMHDLDPLLSEPLTNDFRIVALPALDRPEQHLKGKAIQFSGI